MRLGFYINPIARLRDDQQTREPDTAVLTALAETAGAEIVLVGWNPNNGLISERDVQLIREIIRCDLILVTALDENYVEQVVKFHPEGVVLVSSSWDGVRTAKTVQPEIDKNELAPVAAAYKAAGVQVSALIDPDLPSLKTVTRMGLSGITIDCSTYANAHTDEEAENALDRISDAVMAAHKFNLVASVAHGLHYRNVGPIAGLRFIDEIYIGRAIVNRALVTGVQQAVSDMISMIYRNQISG